MHAVQHCLPTSFTLTQCTESCLACLPRAPACMQDIQVIPGTSNPKLCMLSDEYSPSVAVFNCDFGHSSCGEVCLCAVCGQHGRLCVGSLKAAAPAASGSTFCWWLPPPATCALSQLPAGRPARPTCLLSSTSCFFVVRLQVKVRYVPKIMGGPSYFGSFSGYPVKAILPDSFTMRRNNKGLENVAVSPDGKTAWTMMQVGGWAGGWVLIAARQECRRAGTAFFSN